MGKIRDFRKETLDHMRENLVDENPNWDGLRDWVWSWGVFDVDLQDDLSNFDDYMGRLLEINDITKERLDGIIEDVHATEHFSKALLGESSAELAARRDMLTKMVEALSQDDFEASFNKVKFKRELKQCLPGDMLYDLSDLSPESLRRLLKQLTLEQLLKVDYDKLDASQRKAYIAEVCQRLKGKQSAASRQALIDFLMGLPAGEIVHVDVSALTADERRAYYRLLYQMYSDPNISAADKAALEKKLARMSHGDAMNLVFDTPGQYGGDQGYGVSRAGKNDAAYRVYLLSLLDARFNLGSLTTQEKEQLITDLADDMNKSGCGYISMVNAIMVEYANKPKEFEARFGFPMVDANGQFNFHYLFGYVYLTNIDPNFDPTLPYDKETNRPITGGGGSAGLRQGTLDALGIDGVHSDGTTHAVDSDAIRQQLDAGNAVVISINPCVMYELPPSSKANMEWSNARPSGHAMIVTGVDANGNLLVSSWGKQYIIYAAEFGQYGNTHTYTNNNQTETFTGFISYEVYTENA